MDGEQTEKLELPMPELGEGTLEAAASDLQRRIRIQTPPSLRESVKVRPFREGARTGLAIEYDDRAENFVYAAIEYPIGSGKAETVEPRKATKA